MRQDSISGFDQKYPQTYQRHQNLSQTSAQRSHEPAKGTKDNMAGFVKGKIHQMPEGFKHIAGCREDYLNILKENVPHVKAEPGCIAYEPTVDVDAGLPVQGELRENVVTLVEAWESLDALQAHLKTAHMASYREAVKDLVVKLSIDVLQPA